MQDSFLSHDFKITFPLNEFRTKTQLNVLRHTPSLHNVTGHILGI